MSNPTDEDSKVTPEGLTTGHAREESPSTGRALARILLEAVLAKMRDPSMANYTPSVTSRPDYSEGLTKSSCDDTTMSGSGLGEDRPCKNS